MLYATIELKASNPNVSVGLYTLSRLDNNDVRIPQFKSDWLECLADRKEMEGCDGGIMDIAWMVTHIQYYGWELKSKDIPISCVVSV